MLVINRNKQNKQCESFIVNNENTSEKKKVSIAFNEYFVNIGANLSHHINDTGPDACSLIKTANTNSMFLFHVTAIEIENVIKSLKNNAAGHDISACIFKRYL